MKQLPPTKESAESAALVQELFEKTALSDYMSVPDYLPVHIHAKNGAPTLKVAAIHLFPEGYDAPDADLLAPDCGDNRVYMFGDDVTCRVLHTGTYVGVAGTLTAVAIDGNSGTNCCLVARRIVAELILERGHSFECNDIKAGVVYSGHGMIEGSEDAAALFREELIDEGEPDTGALLDAIRTGKPWRV